MNTAMFILVVMLAAHPAADNYNRSAESMYTQTFSSKSACMAARDFVQRNTRTTLVAAECMPQ